MAHHPAMTALQGQLVTNGYTLTDAAHGIWTKGNVTIVAPPNSNIATKHMNGMLQGTFFVEGDPTGKAFVNLL